MDNIELDFEQAKAKHILFKTSLRSILYGAEIDETPVLSQYECAVGKWIYSHALAQYNHLPEIIELEKVHAKIHTSAQELITLYKTGHVAEARNGLENMELIADYLVTLLTLAEIKIKDANKNGQSGINAPTDGGYKELAAMQATILQLDNAMKKEVAKSAGGEAKFQNMVMQAPVGITILLGPNFVVEMANEAYLQLVDRPESTFVGRPLFESLPEVKPSAGPILENVFKTGIPYLANEFEITVNRFGKKEQGFFNFVYQPLKDVEGNISGIMVVATDVTIHVEAKKAVQRSESLFRTLVDQSPVAMTIFKGPDFIIDIANEAMLKNLWRRSMEEVQGKKLLEVFPELEEQQFPELLKNVLASGLQYRANEVEAIVNGKDGLKKYYLDFEYAPLFNDDKTPYGIMATVMDVTEKVDTRQVINDSAERLRLATEGTQTAIWDINMQTSELVHSERFAVIFGYPPTEQLTHRQVRNHFLPTDKSTIVEPAFAKAIETGEYRYEARIKQNNGSVQWVRTIGKVVFDHDKRPLRMLGTLIDITEQKESDEKLARLAAIVQSSDDAIISKTMDGIVTSWNHAAERIFGYKQDEMIGKPIAILFPQDRLDEEPNIIARLKQGERVEHIETLRLSKEGKLIDVSITISPIKDVYGNVIGASKIVRDISTQKETERLINESEQKFKLLADSMPQFIWTSGKDGTLNYFSQSVYNFSGLNEDEVKANGWLEIVHPDDREENISKWITAIATGEPFSYEHRFRRYDGEYRWQLSRAIPQRDEAGSIQIWVGTSTDIHDHKLMTDKLESMVQQRTSELKQINNDLVKLNSELAQFAYVASHDLQEPLRKIQTFATLLLDSENERLSPRGKDYFGRMQAASRRMQQLILDILSYSRANTSEKHYEHADLNKLLATVVENLKETLTDKNASVTLDKLPTLDIIPFQMEQLFNNLISNALKFSRAGVAPVVNITYNKISGSGLQYSSADATKTYHRLTVSDNGIGFAPQFSERIFQVFQRLHNKDTYEGTGIGLAICKKIVENHNGFIIANGEEDKGARFDIYIPAS